MHGAPYLSLAQRARLDTQLAAALEALHRIESQSRQLVGGKALGHCKIINAHDPTLTPICKGKSHGPAEFGRKPGIIVERAASFTVALHLPVGNPSDARYVEPLMDNVEQTIAPVGTCPTPAIHSLAGDRALNDAALHEVLHERRIASPHPPQEYRSSDEEPLAQGHRTVTASAVRRVAHRAEGVPYGPSHLFNAVAAAALPNWGVSLRGPVG